MPAASPTPSPLPTPDVRWLDTSAGRIRVRTVGRGPDLLFVHGALVDGHLWDPLLPLLAPHARCLVPDWPLGSQPEALAEGADLSKDGLAQLILEVAERLGAPRPILVGNDSGGGLSQMTAGLHPDRVAGLVLTNCDALEVFPPKAYELLLAVARRPWATAIVGPLLHHLPRVARAMRGGYGALARTIDLDDIVRWTRPVATSPGVRRDLAKVFGGLSAADTQQAADDLARADLPIHLVWGERDPFFPLALARRLQAKVGATLDVVEGARTYVMLDEPEAVAASVVGWLQSGALARAA